jgi:hypothetical protein
VRSGAAFVRKPLTCDVCRGFGGGRRPFRPPKLQCAEGKPVAHPLHRYITYEKRRCSTRYIPVTYRYTGAARRVADAPTAAAGLAPWGNRRHTGYTVTLPMRNGAFGPVTYRYIPLQSPQPGYFTLRQGEASAEPFGRRNPRSAGDTYHNILWFIVPMNDKNRGPLETCSR